MSAIWLDNLESEERENVLFPARRAPQNRQVSLASSRAGDVVFLKYFVEVFEARILLVPLAISDPGDRPIRAIFAPQYKAY